MNFHKILRQITASVIIIAISPLLILVLVTTFSGWAIGKLIENLENIIEKYSLYAKLAC